MPDINDTLAERGSRYADFRDNAIVAQDIKEVFRDSPNWNKLPGYMQEGLDMFASKISRMLTGDFLYDDNIHDVIGYAKLMQDRMAQDRDNPVDQLAPGHEPPLDLAQFNAREAFGPEFLFDAVQDLGFCDSLGFALALLGSAGFRVNDEGSIVNDQGDTPDVVYRQHFPDGEPPAKVDGSKVPNPSFFRDPLREVMTRDNAAPPPPPPPPPPASETVDAGLRQDMWDDHRGRVAWAYTDSKAVAEELDGAHFDDEKSKIDWLLENVLANHVDLYAMRQQDVDGVYCLGAFEIPKK